MKSVLLPVLLFIRDSLRTRVALQAEVLALRHQLLVPQRGHQKQRLRQEDEGAAKVRLNKLEELDS
jgi:hypothetical protein